MSTFKKAKVVMLPTNQKAKEGMIYLKPKIGIFNKTSSENHNNDVYDCNPQHLYIISDDEIKLFDCVYNNKENIVEQITSKTQLIFVLEENKENQTFKKIIATTDTSLLIDTYINQGDTVKGDLIIKRGSDYTTGLKGRINLPQPSQQFIQKYIEEYNKDNIITDVLVGYELVSNEEYFLNTINPDDDVPYFDENLKINPKDNTITIKKLINNWNREEVIELCKQAFIDGTYAGGFGPNEKTINSETEKWIKENL